jgi:hypothetical protein
MNETDFYLLFFLLLFSGVSIKDRKWRLREYKQCFVGKELVDWFINEKIVGTREEAVILGNFYLEHNIFTHVVKGQYTIDKLFLFPLFLFHH